MRYRLTASSFRDLSDIGDYIARDNPLRAKIVIEALRLRCRQLCDFPFANPERPQLEPGIRIAVSGRYLIFYAVADDIVEIRRILHGARSISADDMRP